MASCVLNITSKQPKILIVGAGVAGITAARGLVKAGLKDVTIFEAQNRIGGRIFTKDYGDHIIELGAQWIHGEEGNPIFDLAKKHGLVDSEFDDDEEEYDNHFYTQRGEKLGPELVKEVIMVLDNIYEEANLPFRQNLPTSKDESVGKFFESKFDAYLESCNDPNDVREIKKGMFDWRSKLEKSDNACQSLNHVSLLGWGAYLECPGNPSVELKQGFRSVLDLLLQDIPEGCIHLNKAVSNIEWKSDQSQATRSTSSSGDNTVVVHCEDGGSFHADHVIVTSSLGFLKKRADDLFFPSLPTAKLDAINQLQFGTANKVYLEFEQPFWDKYSDGIQLVWLPGEEIQLRNVDNKARDQNGFPWYKGLFCLDTVAKQPNLLQLWFSNEEAVAIETIPDDELIAVVMEIAEKFTNIKNIPKPIKITKTKWHSTDYVHGSYSYIPVNTSVDMVDVLAEPLMHNQCMRVQFAGEATQKNYYGTVHAAYMSGEREAGRLCELYREK